MAALKFDIGSSVQVVLEKWQQMKNGQGSLTDTLVRRYGCFANVDNISSARVHETNQTKQRDTWEMIVRKRGLDEDDVNVKWKLVYKGKRHAIISKKLIDKKNSDFLITVEVK